MSEEQTLQVVQELIKAQYESMGLAVLKIDCFSPGTFKLEIIDAVGPREILVTLMLHMVPIYAPDKRQQTDHPPERGGAA